MPCKECLAEAVHHGMVVAASAEEDGRTTVRLATCKGVEEASCQATVKAGQLLAYRELKQLGCRLELPVRPLDASVKDLQFFEGGSTFVVVFRHKFPPLRKFGKGGMRIAMDHPVLHKILLTQPEAIVANRDYFVAAVCYSPPDAPTIPFTALAFRMTTKHEFKKFDFRLLKDAEGARTCDEVFRRFTARFAANPEPHAALDTPAVAGPSGVGRTSGAAVQDAHEPTAQPQPSASPAAAERADDEDEDDEEIGIRYALHRPIAPLPDRQPPAAPQRRDRQPPRIPPHRDLREQVETIDGHFINNPRVRVDEVEERRYLILDHTPPHAATPPAAQPAAAPVAARPDAPIQPTAPRVPAPRPPPPRPTPATAPEETAARPASPTARNDANERTNDHLAPPAAPTPNLIDLSHKVQPLQAPAELQPELPVEVVAEERPPSAGEQETSERWSTPPAPSTPPPSLDDAREASVEREEQPEDEAEERAESPDAPRLLPPDLRAEARDAVRGMSSEQLFAAITKEQFCGLFYVVMSTGLEALQRAPDAPQQLPLPFGAAPAGGSEQPTGRNIRAGPRGNSPGDHERERLGRLQASAPAPHPEGPRPATSRPPERYRSGLLDDLDTEHPDADQ